MRFISRTFIFKWILRVVQRSNHKNAKHEPLISSKRQRIT